MQTCFTIGYGGRRPADFVQLLKERQVRVLVDVRLEPRRASMGAYVRAKSAEKGIAKLLADAGVEYVSLTDLGNPFRGEADWRERYATHLKENEARLLRLLADVPRPYCLMCAEKRVEDCHRKHIAEGLQKMGMQIEHIE